MPAADLLEDRYCSDTGRSLKHRHDLALPHVGKRVGLTSPTGLAFCDGNRGSVSIRYPAAVEIAAFVAAMANGMGLRELHVKSRAIL
jgi:hypothetical protein